MKLIMLMGKRQLWERIKVVPSLKEKIVNFNNFAQSAGLLIVIGKGQLMELAATIDTQVVVDFLITTPTQYASMKALN